MIMYESLLFNLNFSFIEYMFYLCAGESSKNKTIEGGECEFNWWLLQNTFLTESTHCVDRSFLPSLTIHERAIDSCTILVVSI